MWTRIQAQTEQGSSLIEAVIGIALVAVVASSMGSLMLTAMFTSETAADLTEQTAQASQQMEQLLLLPFDNIALRAGGSLTASRSDYSVDPLDGDPDRYLRWEIVDEVNDFKRIIVIAGVRDPAIGPTREVRVETFRKRTE